MSDHYHFTLSFTLRRDTPQALIAALQAVDAGRPPDAADLAALPGVVAEYLGGQDWTGWPDQTKTATRIAPYAADPRKTDPGDPVWRLHYERLFHDDEFWNGEVYLIWWLFGFSAQQGHLATRLLEFDAPPDIYTRIGDEVIETSLRYDPDTHQALDYRDKPLNSDTPIIVAKTTRTQLAQFLNDIAFMAEGSRQ